MGAEIEYQPSGATSIAVDLMSNRVHFWIQEVDGNGAVIYHDILGYKDRRYAGGNRGKNGLEIYCDTTQWLKPGESTELVVGPHRVRISATYRNFIKFNGEILKVPKNRKAEDRVDEIRYPRRG